MTHVLLWKAHCTCIIHICHSVCNPLDFLCQPLLFLEQAAAELNYAKRLLDLERRHVTNKSNLEADLRAKVQKLKTRQNALAEHLLAAPDHAMTEWQKLKDEKVTSCPLIGDSHQGYSWHLQAGGFHINTRQGRLYQHQL